MVDKKKKFFGNLPLDMTAEALEAALRTVVGSAAGVGDPGKIEEVVVVKDRATGKPKGFGFVTFKAEADAALAQANLSGKSFPELGDRELNVADPKDDDKRDRARDRAGDGGSDGARPPGGDGTRPPQNGGGSDRQPPQGGGGAQPPATAPTDHKPLYLIGLMAAAAILIAVVLTQTCAKDTTARSAADEARGAATQALDTANRAETAANEATKVAGEAKTAAEGAEKAVKDLDGSLDERMQRAVAAAIAPKPDEPCPDDSARPVPPVARPRVVGSRSTGRRTRFDQIEERVDDHERRIRRLETVAETVTGPHVCDTAHDRAGCARFRQAWEAAP